MNFLLYPPFFITLFDVVLRLAVKYML